MSMACKRMCCPTSEVVLPGCEGRGPEARRGDEGSGEADCKVEGGHLEADRRRLSARGSGRGAARSAGQGEVREEPDAPHGRRHGGPRGEAEAGARHGQGPSPEGDREGCREGGSPFEPGLSIWHCNFLSVFLVLTTVVARPGCVEPGSGGGDRVVAREGSEAGERAD
eukprot:3105238-Rhodomonas_salina.2